MARIGIVVVLASAGLVGLVAAQTGPQSGVASDASTPDEMLHRELARRDAVIIELLRRVEKLEAVVASLSSSPAPAPAAGPAAPPPEDPAAPEEAATAAIAPQAPVPAAKPASEQVAQTQPASAAPGEFEVDEEAVDRALERTLVEAGALLLPFGKAEIRPAFSYTRRETDSLVPLLENGDLFAGQVRNRRDEFDFDLGLRVGLPLDSQLELNVPYRVVDHETSRIPDRPPEDRTGSGLGDVSVGLAKTVLREASWWPDLIARVTWNTATGQRRDNEVPLNGDFNEIRGSLTALKRQDPLAFVGSVSYQTAFENDDVDPGDELGFSIGTVLAASPETSLRIALSQTFIDEVEIDGQSINGSDQASAILTLGAAAVLRRGVLVDVSGDIGLTDEAPDYAIRIALPIRFNVPISAPFR